MKKFPVLLILCIGSVALGDGVFRSAEYDVSFRYLESWSVREAQLHTTVVLLYADDGSGATCNLTAGSIQDELVGRSERDLGTMRKINHSEQYFTTTFSEANDNLVVKDYWRGRLGQKDAGYVELENDLYQDDETLRLVQFVGSTFANGRRYTLLCNGLVRRRTAVKSAFDAIRNTLAFTH